MDVWILRVDWLWMIIIECICIRMVMVISGVISKVKTIIKIDLTNLNIFKFLEYQTYCSIVLIVLWQASWWLIICVGLLCLLMIIIVMIPIQLYLSIRIKLFKLEIHNRQVQEQISIISHISLKMPIHLSKYHSIQWQIHKANS